jgi:hypothetical protein
VRRDDAVRGLLELGAQHHRGGAGERPMMLPPRPHDPPCLCMACMLWDGSARSGQPHVRWHVYSRRCPNCDEPTRYTCVDCLMCLACHYSPAIREANSGHPEMKRAAARVLQ